MLCNEKLKKRPKDMRSQLDICSINSKPFWFPLGPVRISYWLILSYVAGTLAFH